MRPDTPADHIAEAERLLRTAAQYPDDREPLLLRAAAHLELAGERTRATPLYDELLAADAAEPYLIKALKASNLWEYGHEAEARAIIEGIRAAGPLEPGPWQIAAETLESHDELESAHDFLSTALTLLLAPGEEVPYTTQSLLIGRHRVRRLMGVDHDTWDDLTDTLHTATVPLDELHDPKRLWSLGSSDPSELQAEITRLRAELGTYRTALSRPFPVAVLHWPEPELSELLAAYPTLRAEYPSHTEHLADLEAALRDLHSAGTPNLGIVTGTVPSYEAFAASEAASPSDPNLLPQYATTLAARGRAVPWPPARTAACWCGSGRAYRDCHGVA
ncbi:MULTISPECIES: SEC-C domain-containing protein [unclassified Streptomyces]|uniref:SEC-C domain-containing protein n=2 Tax=unclassified Streptomyces TaxID=2593676 RepID=UPI002DDACB2C|nr:MULTISPECIES: SEC-C domain-containing protein [unclassified Streptomyces]WSC37187.1 SEC-C domain-containing protein [Streptomyces sp. NBC_01763]WSC45319.1 SEC-C domain-containing protein [Streptomyces sp. NBC_01762]WSD24980.1 SEC-C domain-containing protein [Streptomyces sp. NBC_01751]WSF86542.1 SEC-C domain-containing protein [Streptomyces sp. NBC_01744]